MVEVSTNVSDNIYNSLLDKYKGDRILATKARDEIISFLHLYAKHISEVKPEKATPKYCVGDYCFDTVARTKLFTSIYPHISEVISEVISEIPPEVPPEIPIRKYRYVEFDIVFCCYYPKESDDILYGRIIYGLIYTEIEYSFKETLKEWAYRVTNNRWDTVSMDACRLRQDNFESIHCNDILGIEIYHVEYDETEEPEKIEKIILDPKKFINGVRISKLEEGYA